jgi:heptosyltransferase-2
MVGEIARGLDVVDLSGLCSLHELMYVMQNASLLICNDSMPLHMACAMQVPCVAMFCATTPSLGFWPWKNRARIIEKNLPCRPCGTHGGERCPTGKDDCRTGIGIEEVLERAESLIHNNHLNLQLAC